MQRMQQPFVWLWWPSGHEFNINKVMKHGNLNMNSKPSRVTKQSQFLVSTQNGSLVRGLHVITILILNLNMTHVCMMYDSHRGSRKSCLPSTTNSKVKLQNYFNLLHVGTASCCKGPMEPFQIVYKEFILYQTHHLQTHHHSLSQVNIEMVELPEGTGCHSNVSVHDELFHSRICWMWFIGPSTWWMSSMETEMAPVNGCTEM